jgi:hypothetical protein
MPNDVTTQEPEANDGFSGSLTGGRLIKGQLLRWNVTNGWTDRDDLRPPEIMLVFALTEAVQRWKDKKPAETITTKPLPSVEERNNSVPAGEWEPGPDGKPKAPWVHQYVVYLLDPATARTFTYLNSTTGARIAWELLQEQVVTMRMLRNSRVVPLVKLSQRPFESFVGHTYRPDFEILGWRQLGGDGGDTLAKPQTPLLTGPAAAEIPAAAAPVVVATPASATVTAAPAQQATPKPPVNLTNETLAVMGDVKPATTAEILNTNCRGEHRSSTRRAFIALRTAIRSNEHANRSMGCRDA